MKYTREFAGARVCLWYRDAFHPKSACTPRQSDWAYKFKTIEGDYPVDHTRTVTAA